MIRLCVLFMVLFSCTAQAQPTVPLDWLIGTWVIENPNGKVVEIWTRSADGVLNGEGYFMNNAGEKMGGETIQIVNKDGKWYYVPAVKNQNDGKPVYFEIIMISKGEFISENPNHDFPQRIAYRRVGDRMFASIEGRKEGAYSKYNFDYVLSGM